MVSVVAAVLGAAVGLPHEASAAPGGVIPAGLVSVEFEGMPAPCHDPTQKDVAQRYCVDQRTKAYTTASARLAYADGTTRSFPLRFHELHATTSQLDGVFVGDLYDAAGRVLVDSFGNPRRSEAPDANSLFAVPGAKSSDPRKRRLFLVTHFEYDWLDSAGAVQHGRQPMTMNLATIDQDPETGALETVSIRNVDMSGVGGLWTPCAGSLSPWNTHLGSEEYEPDARCQVEAGCPSGAGGLDAMHRYLAPIGRVARAYDYGLTPEVTVDRDGKATVVKHRALGRLSRERVEVMPDRRTAYQGDDGTYTVLTLFVADHAADLSAGTLYAARWNQTSDANGGAARLAWHRLGHASDAEIEAMVDGGIRFSDIFDTSPTMAPGFKTIKAGHGRGLIEHLRLKDGMEKAAAFLETRRYAAYVGATSEFEKLEGVTVNRADGRLYVAMSRLRGGMENDHEGTEPANDIRVPGLLAGAVYEIELAGGQVDAGGLPIDSAYVGVAMRGLILGEDIAKDPVGNTAAVDRVANPDNLEYSERMRTLFIGEDSGTAHVNNFLWAYNVDTHRLSRILSLPAGAESTGLQVLDDMNGHAYFMSNYQHPGDLSRNTAADLRKHIEENRLIDRHRAAIGYLGGLPGLK